MSHFKPTPDERDTLKKAVTKFAHDPFKAQMLASLDAAEFECLHGSEEWNKIKVCLDHHLLHAQAELHRDPNKKANRLLLNKADALARKFHPNFS